ncbi:hypothetical protein CHARACLAT_015083 [Characodon lateralis]|uniref:Cytochrome P450 n=1 Tax=Characodon lateralis TaxID=208331 RepID=A0ABU7F3I5_9TELE|nr:hypothetical protein [Characodon lateralis]
MNTRKLVFREPRDFVDYYMDELENRDYDSTFSEEQLTRITLDLYVAGTDTTSNTLLTGFLYLMNYPHIQAETWPKLVNQQDNNP